LQTVPLYWILLPDNQKHNNKKEDGLLTKGHKRVLAFYCREFDVDPMTSTWAYGACKCWATCTCLHHTSFGANASSKSWGRRISANLEEANVIILHISTMIIKVENTLRSKIAQIWA